MHTRVLQASPLRSQIAADNLRVKNMEILNAVGLGGIFHSAHTMHHLCSSNQYVTVLHITN